MFVMNLKKEHILKNLTDFIQFIIHFLIQQANHFVNRINIIFCKRLYFIIYNYYFQILLSTAVFLFVSSFDIF